MTSKKGAWAGAAIAALVFAAVAAGCGGGNDRLSQDELRQRANAICKRYDQKLQNLGSPSSPDAIPQFVEKAIPIIEQGVAELRELNPPEDIESDYDRMLEETEKAIPAARKLADAAQKQDAAAVQAALQAGQRANAAADRIATRLGMTGCVSD